MAQVCDAYFFPLFLILLSSIYTVDRVPIRVITFHVLTFIPVVIFQ